MTQVSLHFHVLQFPGHPTFPILAWPYSTPCLHCPILPYSTLSHPTPTSTPTYPHYFFISIHNSESPLHSPPQSLSLYLRLLYQVPRIRPQFQCASKETKLPGGKKILEKGYDTPRLGHTNTTHHASYINHNPSITRTKRIITHTK